FYIEEEKISDSKLSELDEAPNYKEAMASPEATKWKEAMKSKIRSMYDNQVWNLVDTTPGLKTMGCKWIFKKKTHIDGKVHMYEARLVTKGYTQTHMIDYEETFSPVAKIKLIRIMLAIDAFHDYEIWKMDVKTAFLNRKLAEDVFMAQPEGSKNAKYPKRVCKLQKPIYLNRLLVARISASMRKSHSLDFLEAKMSPV
nr:retrotransposon protein, putative, Ty1-copia subclass [Tanacetum cinerariifolium]